MSHIALPQRGRIQLIYICYLAALLLGLPSLIGLVLAYFWRQENNPPGFSHFRFQIRTFWLGLLYSVVCLPFTLIPLFGAIPYLFIGLWFLIRTVRGILAAGRDEPIRNPGRWGF